MKKVLKVEVEEIPTTTVKYNYSYIDNKNFKVKVEGIGTIEDLKKDIESKLKKLSNDSYKITMKK